MHQYQYTHVVGVSTSGIHNVTAFCTSVQTWKHFPSGPVRKASSVKLIAVPFQAVLNQQQSASTVFAAYTISGSSVRFPYDAQLAVHLCWSSLLVTVCSLQMEGNNTSTNILSYSPTPTPLYTLQICAFWSKDLCYLQTQQKLWITI